MRKKEFVLGRSSKKKPALRYMKSTDRRRKRHYYKFIKGRVKYLMNNK